MPDCRFAKNAWLVGLSLVVVAVSTRVAWAQPEGLDPTLAFAGDGGDDGGSDAPVVIGTGIGYIDPAIVTNQARFRFDAAYDNVKPARAEFFWAVDGPFGPGPGPELSVDYQDFSLYLEGLATDRISLFGELPIRLIDPVLQDNTGGLGDSNVGFKWGMIQDRETLATFQFRTYIPSGDETRGLGNGHVSLEPAFLFYQELAPRLALEGELRDWIAIGGSDDFAGNVLRYGLGTTYRLTGCCGPRLYGVCEVVGWTVLDGQTAVTAPSLITTTENADGDTIVNAKFGLRWAITPLTSLYGGYGRVLTEQTWYDDTIRIELRRFF